MAAVLAAAVVPVPAAHADEVRVVQGTATSSSDVYLTYVNCDDFFAPSLAPRTRINLGPAQPPLGRRSMGLVPTGTHTGSGPMTRFASLAGLSSSVWASAGQGTTGVSYLWVLTGDTLPGTAWRGHASLTLPPGGWHQVDAATIAYTWDLVDLATRQVLTTSGPATPGAFAGLHGDGHGYVVTGFGCDGRPFNVDAVSSAGAVYDFEGVELTTSMSVSAAEVQRGATVTLSGTVRDASGRVTGDPLRLEQREPGGAWRAVGDAELADPDSVTRAEVVVDGPTEFRWHRPVSQYADEGWSATVSVAVTEPAQPAQPETPAPEQEQSTPTPQEPAPTPQ